MVVQLRSGKELSNNRVEMKGKTKQEDEEETGRENRKNSSELTTITKNKVHAEQQEKNCEQKQKEKV